MLREPVPADGRRPTSRVSCRPAAVKGALMGRVRQQRPFAQGGEIMNVAAQQAMLLRQQETVLKEEFQAVLGPIDEAVLREAAKPLQDLPVEALLERTEALLQSIRERIAGWADRGGLVGHVHERLSPVLAGQELLQVRDTVVRMVGAR